MEVKLNTRLVTSPVSREVAIRTIQIGSSPIFKFELEDKVYKFDDISQLYFIFRQGQGDVIAYPMVPENAIDANGFWNGELDDHFRYNEIFNQIEFTMEPEETLDFKPSRKNSPSSFLQCEVTVKLELIGQEKEMVMQYNQGDIFVLDSLYKHIIEV